MRTDEIEIAYTGE